MTDSNVFPPPRSAYDVVGELKITGADMNRVVDATYPWRDYVGSSEPAYHRKIAQLLAKRDAEVDHYVLTRRRYWEQVTRWHFGNDREVQITEHHGITSHRSHTVEKTHNVMERIAADLNIDIRPGGSAVPGGGEVPPPVPAAMAAATGGGGNGGGDGGGSGGSGGLHFSREVADTLHITDVEEDTYIDERTTMTTESFKGNTTYIQWQLTEECILQRVRKASERPDSEPVSVVRVAVTSDTRAFPTGDSNGHIH